MGFCGLTGQGQQRKSFIDKDTPEQEDMKSLGRARNDGAGPERRRKASIKERQTYQWTKTAPPFLRPSLMNLTHAGRCSRIFSSSTSSSPTTRCSKPTNGSFSSGSRKAEMMCVTFAASRA